MKAPPVLQAFVLADHVYTDADTLKHVVAGTYTAINAPKFPALHQSSYAYIVLTEFDGVAPLQLRLVRLADHRVILQSNEIEIECQDPLQTIELAIPIPVIQIVEPGIYAFECYVDQELISAVRVVVRQVGSGDQSQ